MKTASQPKLKKSILQAEICRRHLSEFVKTFWEIVVADELQWSTHMQIMCDEIQTVYERTFLKDRGRRDEKGKPVLERLPKLYDLIINVPPGTSKSTICTVMAPAWAWTNDPSIRCITGSYSDSLAMEHSVKSRDIVESDLYRKLYPDVEIKYDKGRKTNYETTKLGQRYATSVGGTVTGVHAHAITIDDPLNPKQAATQLGNENANNWMDKTLSMRKVNKAITPTILVMQRLAANDCTGYLLAKKKVNVRHVCLPAEDSINVKPAEYRKIYINGLLDPERLGRDVLAEAKKDLGGDGYAGQMAQVPVQEGGRIWQKWFKELDDDMFPDIADANMLGTDWDLAYTDDDANAASAYITAGKVGGKAFIFDLDFVFLEYPELIRYMKNRRAPHYIEAKACFVAGTKVRTQKGLKNIEDIQEGEKVLSFNTKEKHPEFKKVKNTFVFTSQYSRKLCIFHLKNGLTIKCTKNHEFYINGSWIESEIIAERVMGMDSGNRKKIFDFNNGKTPNNGLQKPVRERSKKDNETSVGRKWVFKNYDKKKRKNFNRKNASFGSRSIYSEPGKQTTGKSYKFSQERQSFIEPGMGNPFRKSSTFCERKPKCGFQNRNETKKSRNRIKKSKCDIKRANRKGNKSEVQTKNLYKKNVSRGIWNKYPFCNRCNLWKRMEACELNLENILSVEIVDCIENIYDLHVEDNNNYCITSENIIVHNSGKSAKQSLTRGGIPAIEVKVMGGSDKVSRAKMATPPVEAGLVFIKKSLADKLYNDERQGILNFPKNSHKDLADALAQSMQRLFSSRLVIARGSGSILDKL